MASLSMRTIPCVKWPPMWVYLPPRQASAVHVRGPDTALSIIFTSTLDAPVAISRTTAPKCISQCGRFSDSKREAHNEMHTGSFFRYLAAANNSVAVPPVRSSGSSLRHRPCNRDRLSTSLSASILGDDLDKRRDEESFTGYCRGHRKNDTEGR